MPACDMYVSLVSQVLAAIWQLCMVDEVFARVQVNGKMRGTVEVPVDVTQDVAVESAQAVPAVMKQLDGKNIVKVIFVPGKILNLIAK